MLDFQNRDEKWISPEGIDLTDLCNRSQVGGFSSNQWTTSGWILDDMSLASLGQEFPWFFEDVELGALARLGLIHRAQLICENDA